MAFPRVFDSGGITLCANQDRLRLYVGQAEIEHIRSLELKLVGTKPQVIISFNTSEDPDIIRSIEETMRAVKMAKWIRVE